MGPMSHEDTEPVLTPTGGSPTVCQRHEDGDVGSIYYWTSESGRSVNDE